MKEGAENNRFWNAVAVKKIGHMAKFLGFADGQLLDAGLDQILADGAVNPGRIHHIHVIRSSAAIIAGQQFDSNRFLQTRHDKAKLPVR